MMILRTVRSVTSNFANSGFLRPPRGRHLCVSTGTLLDMVAKDGELRVFIVAGEVSGDTIASRLMGSLKKLSPLPIRFSGVGGPSMSREGLESTFPMEDISVMGIAELLPHLIVFRARLKETIEAAMLFQPHVVVTVDTKGFSFRLLKQLRARCSKEGLNTPLHFHYVAPSFWAWKGGEERLKGLASFVDHIFCILPNEEAVCKLNGVDATFVGHPVLEDVLELDLGKKTFLKEWKLEGNCEDFRRKYAIPSSATTISLLPGSRLQEVTRMLPIFARSIEQLRESFPELMSVIHVAPNLHVEKYIHGAVEMWPGPAILIPGGHPRLKYDAFSASKVAFCTSGTVAMELQLANLPCVVAYRAHVLTEWFIKRKAKIPYMSLPNILMNSAIIPEALFQESTPTNLAALLKELILNKALKEKQIVATKNVFKLLFPSERIINKFVEQDKEWGFLNYTPSMIAASIILCHPKT